MYSTDATVPDLEIEGLTKRFGDHTILDNLNLSLSFAERVVVLGPSGSGKSTFLRCLMGLESIDAGLISFQGKPYVQADGGRTRIDKLIQRKVGMVFQHYTLFPHLTVMKNLILAPTQVRRETPDSARDRAQKLLQRLGLEDKADTYPARLSGGQKQRTAIARALLLEPKLLLFDEVTSALDPELVSEVLDVMLDLAQRDMGMIIITHEMAFARRIGSRIIFLDEGQVVEDDSTEVIFTNPKSDRTRSFLSHFHNGSRYLDDTIQGDGRGL